MVKIQKKKNIKLSNQLVLHEYMLSLMEVDSLEELTKDMKDSSLEELDIDNTSRFYKHLASRLINRTELNKDVLRQYDENIVRFTFQINKKRRVNIKWKYFQYLSLLFTEIYLDRYFNQRNRLLDDLNSFIEKYNKYKTGIEKIDYYDESDLKKLAFWNATGSGKTLLMHINILQYLHYFSQNNRRDNLEQIILLTPSEDLSKQHLREFQLSGLQATLFDKNMQGLFRSNEISIIDIHKLRDKMGEKSIAIEAFEGNNLVLVDEGHKGASGYDWRNKREKLSEEGFAFEYSATFGQAVSGKPELIEEYSKCILFDYSYRYFYKDGYGKDYKILNLQDDSDEQIRFLYLTACLTSFYQQLKLYNENEYSYRPFMLEKPLLVFVGGSVNALRQLKGKKVSDVTDVLLFIADFIKNSRESINMINRLLSGKPGLLDKNGNEIFGNAYPYLISQEVSAEEIYQDILLQVFNSSISNATLRVENLKGLEGEIALRIGENEPFGIINVADVNELTKLCSTYPELYVTEKDFSRSYFHDIDKEESSINVLIGSKKFNEGWSSWRVCTMGLMNMGRSEGSQIIQLFGRGVRLKGYDFNLKRSEWVKDKVSNIPKYLDYVETLNIFGIRADYMQQFKDYLNDEGIQTELHYEEINLPVINSYPDIDLQLKSLRLKSGINFKKQGPTITFKSPRESLKNEDKIVVNWYPKIQLQRSRQETLSIRESQASKPDVVTFSDEHIAFMDIHSIYFELQRFKSEKKLYNLTISQKEIERLLYNNQWYQIEMPKEELKFDSVNKIKRWQEIAIVLLKKYCEKQYLYEKKGWESSYIEKYDINEKDSNFIKEYKFKVDSNDESLILKIKQLEDSLKNKQLIEFEFGGLESLLFSQHLYQPLISLEENTDAIKISPEPLNKGESNFLKDLKSYYDDNPSTFEDKKLYILRNQSKGKGIGFFEAGSFYPDFIIWILYDNKQYITFVDPKGIRHHSITDTKLQFYQYIKELDERLDDKDLVLNAFTIANTSYHDLLDTGMKLSKEEMRTQHILFQNDDKETYIKEMLSMILNNE